MSLQSSARKILTGSSTQAGQRDATSALRGLGMEFAEVRAYHIGDDPRHLDWKVTARTGKPHTKVFHPDSDVSVIVAIDLRAPMDFGTCVGTKGVVALELATLLAHSVIDDNGSCRAMIATPSRVIDTGECRGERGRRQWCASLASACLDEPSDVDDTWQGVLSRVAADVAQSCAIAFIITGVHDISETETRSMRAALKRSGVVMCVVDRFEREELPSGTYPLARGDQRFDVTFGRNTGAIAKATQERLEILRDVSASTGAQFVELDAGATIDASALHSLQRRR